MTGPLRSPRFAAAAGLFLAFQGGIGPARRQVLRHLTVAPAARVLEVGVGDGENVPLLPPGCDLIGVDVARSRLEACRDRFPRLAGRLVLAEAETPCE